MARNTSPAADARPAVAFEVERFAWTASDRLEVTGRWFGLRGHRFMRPALLVEAGDDHRRLLALLEHKPWAADDGEPWTAAFAWDGDAVELTAAELAVAPSVAIDLPPPAAPGSRSRGSRRRTSPPARAAPRIPARGDGRGDALARELADARAEIDRLRSEQERDRRAAREEVATLGAQVADERARAEALEAAAAEAAAVTEQDSLAIERDAAVAERDSLTVERDAAVAQRDSLIAERDAARARAEALTRRRDEERRAAEDEADADAARRERDAALAERDAAHDEAARERRALERRIESAERRLAAAIDERDGARLARDAARRERDEVSGRLDAAVGARAKARAERDAALRARDEALSSRQAAEAVAGASAFDRVTGAHAPRERTVRPRPGRSPIAVWLPRLAALAVLVILVVVVGTTLRGVL